MTGSRLHEHRPRFEDTNDFVDFILGLQCLASPYVGMSAPAVPGDASPAPSAQEESLLHLVLGLRRLMTRFERLMAMETRDTSRDEAVPHPPAVLRDLLR